VFTDSIIKWQSNKNSAVIFSFCSLILLFFIPYYILFLILILAALLLTKNYKIILAIIIIGFVSFTNELIEEYRIFITSASALFLFILFFREYGFTFNSYPKAPKEFLYFFTLLFISLGVSTLFSPLPVYGIIAIARTLIFFLIAYLFFSFLKDEKNILVYLYAICGSVIVTGIPMIMDFIQLGFEYYFSRVVFQDMFDLQGSLGYTGLTIFYMAIALNVSFFLSGKFKKPVSKIILSLLLLFNIVVIILANSRGGIVAALISTAFILYTIKPKRMIKASLIAVFITGLFLSAITDLYNAVDIYLRWHTVGDREVYWQMGIDVISDNPIVGLGTDAFDKFFYNYAPSSILGHYKTPSGVTAKPHPHNFFLYYYAENGILGLLSAISLFVLFFYYGFKCISLTRNVNYESFLLSVTITGIGLGELFRAFIEVSGHLTYGYITRDLPFWLMFIILIYIKQKFQKKDVT